MTKVTNSPYISLFGMLCTLQKSLMRLALANYAMIWLITLTAGRSSKSYENSQSRDQTCTHS